MMVSQAHRYHCRACRRWARSVALRPRQSFTRAAEELHLTHGAISRAVRGLEEDLGTPLFEGRSRRVFLTPAGGRLRDATAAAFAAIAAVTLDLRRQTAAPPLVLSCEPTLLMRWVIPR